MLGIAMESWPDDALRRVVDEPVEGWQGGAFLRADTGRRCLLGIAGDAREEEANKDHRPRAGDPVCMTYRWEQRVRRDLSLPMGLIAFGTTTFDRLCTRFGIPRVVRAIKLRALRILLGRHPLDSKLVVLRAGFKTGV